MLKAFIENVYKKLVQTDFRLLSNFNDASISEGVSGQTEYFTLAKRVGPVMYIVAVVCTPNISVYNFLTKEKEYIEILAENFHSLDCKNVFIVNLFIGDSQNPDTERCLVNADAFTGQSIYNIYWSFTLSNGELANSPDQPDDVINLRRLIGEAYKDAALSSDMNLENTSIGELNTRAIAESPYAKKTNKAVFAYVLVFINAIILALMEMNGGSGNIDVLLNFGALSPVRVLGNGEYYRLFTSMFIHIGFTHFLSNSLSLYIFGTRVEKYYGPFNFYVIYIISGLIGSVASLSVSAYTSAGASGANFGVIGAAVAYTRRSGSSLDGLNFYLFIIFILSGILFGITMPGIDNAAHIGGLVTGYLLGELIIFIESRKNKLEKQGG